MMRFPAANRLPRDLGDMRSLHCFSAELIYNTFILRHSSRLSFSRRPSLYSYECKKEGCGQSAQSTRTAPQRWRGLIAASQKMPSLISIVLFPPFPVLPLKFVTAFELLRGPNRRSLNPHGEVDRRGCDRCGKAGNSDQMGTVPAWRRISIM
jgi:hypothetical protein